MINLLKELIIDKFILFKSHNHKKEFLLVALTEQ